MHVYMYIHNINDIDHTVDLFKSASEVHLEMCYNTITPIQAIHKLFAKTCTSWRLPTRLKG